MKMDDSQTPRGLIEKFITASQQEKTCQKSATPSGPKSHPSNAASLKVVKKRTMSESDITKVWKKQKNAQIGNLSVFSESTITPRTTIDGLIHNDESVLQSTRRRLRVPNTSRSTPVNTSLDSSRSKTKKKEVNLRKKATTNHLLSNQSINTGPTPRGMIQGYLAGATEVTPITQEQNEVFHSTHVDDVLPEKKKNQSLGESYYLPSSQMDQLTNTHKKEKRQRQPLNPVDFARKAVERMEMTNDLNMSITTDITEATRKVPDFSVRNEKTEELKRIMSSRQVSMRTPGNISLPDMEDLMDSTTHTGSKIEKKSLRLSRSTRKERESGHISSHFKSQSKSTSYSTSYVENTGEEMDSPTRRRSARISTINGIGTDTDTTVTKSGFTNTKSNANTEQLTDITPLNERSSVMENLERSRRLSSKEGHKGSVSTAPSNVIEDEFQQAKDNDDDQQADYDADDSSSKDEDVDGNDEEYENDDLPDNNQPENDEQQTDKENKPVDDTEHVVSNSTLGGYTGYDTMQTPRLPHDMATPVRPPMSAEPSPGRTQSQTDVQQKPTVRKPRQKKTSASDDFPRLPKSLTKSIFSHFSRFKVSREVVTDIEKIADEYWKNVASDLSAYVHHADRVTVDESDIELLMKRQGFVTENQSMYTLIRKYLPMEYRNELIPVAKSGNVVYPKT